jgi:hypothetical protein
MKAQRILKGAVRGEVEFHRMSPPIDQTKATPTAKKLLNACPILVTSKAATGQTQHL